MSSQWISLHCLDLASEMLFVHEGQSLVLFRGPCHLAYFNSHVERSPETCPSSSLSAALKDYYCKDLDKNRRIISSHVWAFLTLHF